MKRDRINQAVDLLERFDEERGVFGAAQHDWKRAKPYAEKTLADFEKRVKVKLPDDHRAFVRERWSSGAGPYYGLMKLPQTAKHASRDFDPKLAAGEDLVGAIPLADQGCAMTSILVVTGPHRGQVWFDRRDNGGDMALEAPSFAAWIDEWIDRAMIEASQPIFAEHVSSPGWKAHALLDAAADAIERRNAQGRKPTPIDEQYPMDAIAALGWLRVYQSRWTDALAIFEKIRAAKRDDFEASFRLACARLERAKGDPEKWLAEARAGLEHDAWFATRASLLREASEAAFVLEKVDDALGFREALAKHTGEVQDYLMVAWHAVMADDAARAARWIIATAKAGVGCDADASLPKRVDELARSGFIDALANETPEGAEALEAALATSLKGKGR